MRIHSSRLLITLTFASLQVTSSHQCPGAWRTGPWHWLDRKRVHSHPSWSCWEHRKLRISKWVIMTDFPTHQWYVCRVSLQWYGREKRLTGSRHVQALCVNDTPSSDDVSRRDICLFARSTGRHTRGMAAWVARGKWRPRNASRGRAAASPRPINVAGLHGMAHMHTWRYKYLGRFSGTRVKSWSPQRHEIPEVPLLSDDCSSN